MDLPNGFSYLRKPQAISCLRTASFLSEGSLHGSPTGNLSGKLYWATSEHMDNALFRSVLSQVLEPSEGGSRRKIYVVIDNYRIHFAKPILALVAAHSDQIELVTLPTYSPQLNPVERFWKHLRRKVTHNAFFQTIERLLDGLEFFRDLATRPDIVRSVAGLAA